LFWTFLLFFLYLPLQTANFRLKQNQSVITNISILL
jgi:hypothetical protein